MSEYDDGWHALRSDGERAIARLLDRAGVTWRYEHPLAVVEGGKTRIWYPDFTLPGYGILIEYYGRRNDPAYDRGRARKTQTYAADGLAVVGVTPEDLGAVRRGALLGRIDEILEWRLRRWRMGLAAARISTPTDLPERDFTLRVDAGPG